VEMAKSSTKLEIRSRKRRHARKRNCRSPRGEWL